MAFSIILTFVLVNLGWIFFRSPNINTAGTYIWHMVKVWEPNTYLVFADPAMIKTNWLLTTSFILISILIVIRFTLLTDNVITNQKIKTISSFVITTLFFSFAIFAFIYLNSIGGGESSFIYFDF